MRATFQPADWYDLPRWYDLVFAEDTEREADFLEAVMGRHGRTRGRRVLEPACGSGRLLESLARRGYGVSGFDINPRMIRYARARLRGAGLRGRVRQARLDTFAYRRPFDLAHCLVSTFKYLPTERAARRHLRCVAASLKPGGLYVVGLHLSEYGTRARTRERWVARDGGTEVVCNLQIWPPEPVRRRERVRSRLLVRRGERAEGFETTWWFRTYDADEVRQLVRAVPAFEHAATYDFTYSPDRPRALDDRQLDVVLVLRRRAARG